MAKRKGRPTRKARERAMKRKLKGDDLEMYEALTLLTEGKDPTVGNATAELLDSYSIVLRRMVEMRLAQYLHTTMTILRDQFNFNEEQLTQFAKELRRQTRVAQETQEPVTEASS